MHLKVFIKCQMICNAYDDMSGFNILTRGVTPSREPNGARGMGQGAQEGGRCRARRSGGVGHRRWGVPSHGTVSGGAREPQ